MCLSKCISGHDFASWNPGILESWKPGNTCLSKYKLDKIMNLGNLETYVYLNVYQELNYESWNPETLETWKHLPI